MVRCLTGGTIDRLPFGVGIGWSPWGETLQRWRRESGQPDLNPGVDLNFDAGFAKPALYPGIFPEFEPREIERNGEFIISRNERGITLRNRRDGGSMPEFLDYPVKTPADWEALKRERLVPDAPGRVAEDWPAFRTRIRRKGEAVQVGWFPYGIFGTPRDFLGAEELLVSFYTEPEMVRDMMNRLTDVWLATWERVAAEVTIDHIHIWEDMSGRQGSLISPAMIREFMMPCYDRIAAFARAHGVRLISVDTDGDCTELVPVMMEHGVNVFFPFEVQAGCDILAFRKNYPTLGILGGLDKRALAAGRPEIDREVDKAARMAEKGCYVPGFDHLIPPDVPWKNFCYAAEELQKVCWGKRGA